MRFLRGDVANGPAEARNLLARPGFCRRVARPHRGPSVPAVDREFAVDAALELQRLLEAGGCVGSRIVVTFRVGNVDQYVVADLSALGDLTSATAADFLTNNYAVPEWYLDEIIFADPSSPVDSWHLY